MITSNQISAGITISVDDKIYRVESHGKVSPPKGNPFIKTKLRDLMSDEVVEKNFKLGHPIQDVALLDNVLEFLYLDGQDYLFLNTQNLKLTLIPANIVGDKVNYLKEGVEVKATFYGECVFSLELPQFLELMVVKTETSGNPSNPNMFAILETGAKVETHLFIESGDIVKVDTITNEVIQRV
jgi:elongation factor P